MSLSSGAAAGERARAGGTGGELQRKGRNALVCLVCTVDSNAGGDSSLVKVRVRKLYGLGSRLELTDDLLTCAIRGSNSVTVFVTSRRCRQTNSDSARVRVRVWVRVRVGVRVRVRTI